MATPITPEIIERRATVARLHDAGVGQRDIARQLNLTKDVVWRDIRAIKKDRATQPATTATPVARHGATPTVIREDPDATLTLADFDHGLVTALTVLMDEETGDIPPHLSRIIRDAAKAQLAEWRDKDRDIERHDTEETA